MKTQSLSPNMVPLGYMAKRIECRPDWLKAPAVKEILSVSCCISKEFCDYIQDWKHNGFWMLDSPEVIQAIAFNRGIDLKETRLFFYEALEEQFDYLVEPPYWGPVIPYHFPTQVTLPDSNVCRGIDIVTYSLGNSPECSPLSCNSLAEGIPVNEYCLLESISEANRLLEADAFLNSEPGPFRIVAVHEVEWGRDS